VEAVRQRGPVVRERGGYAGAVFKRLWIGCLVLGLVAVVVGAIQVVTWESEPVSRMYRVDGTVTDRPEEAIGIACGTTKMTPVVLMGGSALTLLGVILRLFGTSHIRRHSGNPYLAGPQ
jgi:hypothetical protein